MSDTPYIAGDRENLVRRLREARDAARERMLRATRGLKDTIICPLHDDFEQTVGVEIEILCSRLSEAINALESPTSSQDQGEKK